MVLGGEKWCSYRCVSRTQCVRAGHACAGHAYAGDAYTAHAVTQGTHQSCGDIDSNTEDIDQLACY